MNSISIEKNNSKTRISALAYLRVFAIGSLLGGVFIKSEVAQWERIHRMFLFQEAHMYLIILTALLVASTSMLLIKRFGVTTIDGGEIKYVPKPYHKGIIFGGFTFGVGWAITGACPGPIYAQIGAGEWIAGFTWIGAFIGMYLYGYLKPRLPH